MVHAVKFILSRIALHAKDSMEWKELLRLPEPVDFVHAATGPGVWTEAIVDFFDDGAEDWKRARERGNEKENRRASILAADIMDIFRQRGTTIEANNVVGYAVPTSSGRHRSPADFLLREARTSGPGQLESSGNVCFFLADMMNSRLVTNGYLSQWGEERKGNSNAWKSWIRTRWDLGFLSEIRAAFRHLDADGDGKLTVAEISPAQGLVRAVLRSHLGLEVIENVELLASQSQGDESEPTWNTRFGLPQDPHIWCDTHPRCFEVNMLHLAMATALSDPPQFLQTNDRDLDGALSFEELNWALDEIVAVGQYNERVLRGEAPEPRQSPEEGLSQLPPVASALSPGTEPEPPEPPEFPQRERTGGLWEIDTGDYSGLAGLTVAALNIIDPDDDFADSFEGMGSSTAWLFVAAGALGLLAAGVWCARARLARRNGHGRRHPLKTMSRELEGGALASRTGGTRSRGTTVSRRFHPLG